MTIAVPVAEAVPSRHSLSDPALRRTVTTSLVIACTKPRETVKVANAMLKAPKSSGLTTLATATPSAKFVRLEKA
jgi:hypothetical protein